MELSWLGDVSRVGWGFGFGCYCCCCCVGFVYLCVSGRSCCCFVSELLLVCVGYGFFLKV